MSDIGWLGLCALVAALGVWCRERSAWRHERRMNALRTLKRLARKEVPDA